MRTVLIVDHDHLRTEQIAGRLEGHYQCVRTACFETARDALRRDGMGFLLALYELEGDRSGLELLEKALRASPRTVRILYSTHHNRALIRDALRLARVDAVLDATAKSFLSDLRSQLDAASMRSQATLDLGSAPAAGEPPWWASSLTTLTFLSELATAAESGNPVFVYGEPGSGKDLAAASLRRWRAQTSPGTNPPPRGLQRVRGIVIRVPPLRERTQDLPALAHHILAGRALASGQPARRITPESLAALVRREWRQNVRELRAVLHHAAARSERAGQLNILADHLPGEGGAARTPSQVAKDEGQLCVLLDQLVLAGSIRGAAKLEGISRTNYLRLMNRLGVTRADEPIPASDARAAEAALHVPGSLQTFRTNGGETERPDANPDPQGFRHPVPGVSLLEPVGDTELLPTS